jgi:transketolase
VSKLPRLSPETDALAVSIIRGIAMDAPLKAKSGHQGTAMSLAPLGHVLYSRVMRHDPRDPKWYARDRFILSCGHASILQYALLYLNGYGLELADLQSFRQWDSATPGHPEAGHTNGVEVTTGPLGQGFANAVGMAVAEREIAARFADKSGHFTYVIAGDGCLMEGISHEAASLAGHLGLERLICIFDDNGITIDGSTGLSCSDDVVKRFESYGWRVIVGGPIANDLDALESMLVSGQEPCGKPTLCVLKTTIGDPSPTLKGKHEAHGNPFTAEHVTEAKQAMSIPDEPFFAPHDVVSRYREVAAARGASFRDATGGLPAELQTIDLAAVRAALPQFASDAQLATRVAIQKVLEATSTALPQLIVGSADLTGNTGVKVSSFASQQKSSPEGRQIYYGIREHAMGAASVGMALHGGTLPVCGTFFVFADYMKPAIRLAALSKAKVVFVFSHDSVGVGEDGPTHQPIEQLASLRSIPGLQVIRPADGAETAQAWISALEFDGPTALVLSRQNLPQTTTGVGATAGFEVLMNGGPQPDAAIVATGSEVSVALEAARTLEQVGIVCRVVSMPSWDLTRSRSLAAFESALAGCGRSFSLEAGSTMGWHEFVDQPIGIDRFGASAPGNVVLDRLGISGSSVSDVIRSALGR